MNKSEFHTIELHCAKFSSNWHCVFFLAKKTTYFIVLLFYPLHDRVSVKLTNIIVIIDQKDIFTNIIVIIDEKDILTNIIVIIDQKDILTNIIVIIDEKDILTNIIVIIDEKDILCLLC